MPRVPTRTSAWWRRPWMYSRSGRREAEQIERFPPQRCLPTVVRDGPLPLVAMGIRVSGGVKVAIWHSLAGMAVFAQVLMLFTPLIEVRDTDPPGRVIAAGSPPGNASRRVGAWPHDTTQRHHLSCLHRSVTLRAGRIERSSADIGRRRAPPPSTLAPRYSAPRSTFYTPLPRTSRRKLTRRR